MGQKVHPNGFRLGVIRDWNSRWYEEKNYVKWVHEDLKLKKFIKSTLQHAGISSIDIERAANVLAAEGRDHALRVKLEQQEITLLT